MTNIDKNVKKTPVRRRRRAAGDARENILAAAEAMLMSSGPQSLKLAEVARAAGISNAAVLHHFGSVEAVQSALMERMIHALLERLDAIDAVQPASVEGVLASVKALFQAFEDPTAARLAAWLQLAGQTWRLEVLHQTIRAAVDRRAAALVNVPRDALADHAMLAIAVALGVGLFKDTLAEMIDRRGENIRDAGLALVLLRASPNVPA